MQSKQRGRINPTVFASSGIIVLIIAAVLVAMWLLPKYGVYRQGLAGEAELANAEYSRQVAVREALAKKDAAVLLAEAEVERAKGVAQANKIIGDSLKDNEAYLRYLFVNNLADTKDQIIYVPTEANLPILEANRKASPPEH
jgi:regulator of protease activity HflC (stomatin/prohibitin superfamily)